tara:strand:+ start:299 stop:724 length:426 start_codon:yes stop_codon:yes gene_type:complete
MGMKDIAENREPEFPPEGWTGGVAVMDVRAKETAKGFPAFGLQLVVVEGPDTEKSFWDNIFFSANARFNDQSFAKMEAAGLSKEFWDKDPEPDPDVVNALLGQRFDVRATWDENKDDETRPWLRCTYIPKANDNAGTPQGF